MNLLASLMFVSLMVSGFLFTAFDDEAVALSHCSEGYGDGADTAYFKTLSLV